MSLLDRTYQDVTIYPDEEYTDEDGNVQLRTSTIGFPARATIQPSAASGTSQRRAEQNNEGYETEENYRIRFARSFTQRLGLWTKVEWRGELWTIYGHPLEYTQGSTRMRPRRWYTLARY